MSERAKSEAWAWGYVDATRDVRGGGIRQPDVESTLARHMLSIAAQVASPVGTGHACRNLHVEESWKAGYRTGAQEAFNARKVDT